jgi:ribosome recycling factor
MHPIIQDAKQQSEAALEHLRGEVAGLRTGRASPAFVEHVTIDAYGAPMSIRAVASITVPDAKTLGIEPWDKNLLKAIEKGIQEANLGINPVVDGKLVRLVMPQMTEETRKNLVKVMKEKLEEGRVAVRGAREKARDAVTKMERGKDISEDEKYRLFEELDRLAKEYTGRVDAIGEQKEQEIMTV